MDYSNIGFYPPSGACICDLGWYFVSDIAAPAKPNCKRLRDIVFDTPKSCGFGHPIFPLTGTKRKVVDIDVGLRLPLRLVYDSKPMVPTTGIASPLFLSAPPAFGALWSSSFHKRLGEQFGIEYKVAHRGEGDLKSFKSGRAADVGSDDSIFGSPFSSWNYLDKSHNVYEDYSTGYQLKTAYPTQGGALSHTYSTGQVDGVSPIAGLLIKVVDDFGRAIDLFYEQPTDTSLAPRIYKVVESSGREYTFKYDGAGNLTEIGWPDGKRRQFLYERQDIPWALTGEKDETEQKTLAYDYDSEGRAVSTQFVNDADSYEANWLVPPRWNISDEYDPVADVIWRKHAWAAPQGLTMKDPMGQTSTLGVVDVNGMPRQSTRNQAAGSGCSASESSTDYDSRGNVTSRVDFNDVRTCYAFATDRNVETYRVEGLAKSDACPSDMATFQVDANKAQRKNASLWHSQWKLEARRAEPKRITTTVYNGEADPLNNKAVATCVVGGDPRLPNLTGNNRIALVCVRYEQSTDDETGNQGFAAPAKETRKWSYTYNPAGQVLSETDPRGKVTSYEYWTDTAFTGTGDAARGHWLGDLKSVTNALQQKTEHLEYNKRGQVLTTKFANGSQEQREYHVRGWLTKSTLVPADGGAGQATQYTYFDTGLLKKVTQPDGSFAKYTWDDAHRLTDVTDSVGNTVHYELDSLGNRKSEKFKDPQGALAKTITRTFDALGRMSSSTGLQ